MDDNIFPQAKPHICERIGDRLVVLWGGGSPVFLHDPRGTAERLLQHATGTLDTCALLNAVSIEPGDHESNLSILRTLDHFKLLQQGDRAEQHATSNDRFFKHAATLTDPADSMIARLANAHVLMLGVGGIGAATAPALAAAGVGRLTLVDSDVVEESNLCRQTLYSTLDIGLPKVEVAALRLTRSNPNLTVTTAIRQLHSTAEIDAFLEGVDAVVVAADDPPTFRLWANDACVRRGIPFVGGATRGLNACVYSVVPGVSGCLRCLMKRVELESQRNSVDPLDNANSALASVCAIVGGHIALEITRFITNCASSAWAGRMGVLDALTGHMTVTAWDRTDHGGC